MCESISSVQFLGVFILFGASNILVFPLLSSNASAESGSLKGSAASLSGLVQLSLSYMREGWLSYDEEDESDNSDPEVPGRRLSYSLPTPYLVGRFQSG